MEGSILNDDDSALGSLHCEDVVSVANISELHDASILRGKLSMVGESLCRYRVLVQQNHREEDGGLLPRQCH
jgi:hypothetical protein